jgi:cation diffusion facilitator CzcD-associated flavoprotein CzcO
MCPGIAATALESVVDTLARWPTSLNGCAMPDVAIMIVGAGAAGLSAAGAMRKAGLDPVLLDRDSRIGGTWERRYDRLRLHTVRELSGLAHYPIPANEPRYMPRDRYAAYLCDYARHFDLKIIAGCAARAIRPCEGGRWLVESDCGPWRARAVVIATGQYHEPVLPAWPGRELYHGALLHSHEYRNPEEYAGKRALVVGLGNSGAEIAADLAEHGAAVAVAIRTPPPVVPRDPFGVPVQRTGMLLSRLPTGLADRLGRLTARAVLGDLTRYGMPAPAWLPYATSSVPVIDVGFVAALKRGALALRPAVTRLTPEGAVFADGSEGAFEVIIAATGYRSGLPGLLHVPGALDERGEPAFPSGARTAFPGLYFIGYTHSLRGHLYEANRASRRLAPLVAEYLAL